MPSGVVLVMGSEANGLRPLVKLCCDALVSIPVSRNARKFGVDSLNVASAASLLMRELTASDAPLRIVGPRVGRRARESSE